MNKQQKLDLVLELLEEGLGRRRIAKALETTEWEARTLMAEVMESYSDICETKEEQKSPRREVSRSQPFPKEKTVRPTKTSIKVGSRIGAKGDTKAKIHIRPTSLKVAVLSDIHYPYEDQNCIQLTKAFLQDYQPDMVVFNGDISDCYSVSRYEKNMKNRPDLQEELDYTHDRLVEWIDEFPNTEFKFVEGNHEARLKKHVSANAPSLVALRGLSYQHLVGLDRLNIEWIPEYKDLQIGSLMFTHGTRVRKHAGNTARGHFEDYGCSVIIGHIHRLAVGWKRNKFGHHAMIENGTLCDFDVEYIRFPDWQHGFTTIEFDGDDFNVQQHPITDYKLIGNGKVYML